MNKFIVDVKEEYIVGILSAKMSEYLENDENNFYDDLESEKLVKGVDYDYLTVKLTNIKLDKNICEAACIVDAFVLNQEIPDWFVMRRDEEKTYYNKDIMYSFDNDEETIYDLDISYLFEEEDKITNWL